jgi:hypothetical protein
MNYNLKEYAWHPSSKNGTLSKRQVLSFPF